MLSNDWMQNFGLGNDRDDNDGLKCQKITGIFKLFFYVNQIFSIIDWIF